MIKNWKLSIYLLTNIIGEPPQLDSLLTEELSFRLGFNSGGNKATRAIRVKDMKEVPIPLAKKTIGGMDIYQCSNPIYKINHSFITHFAKRFDCDLSAKLLHESERKSLLTSSGPYKMRFAPETVNLIDKIIYFFRGDRCEVNKLMKSIKYLGKRRNVGYGWIDRFDFEETEDNYSLIYKNGESNYLMKTIPYDDRYFDLVCNATKYYGACKPPYWHPDNQMEVLKPC
jgi:hypothetical protein